MQLFAQASDSTASGGAGFLPLLLFMLVVGYFFFVRPQRARMRQQQQVTQSLEIGDQVRTYGGLFGVVVRIDEDAVVLGIEEGRVRVAKAAIAVRTTSEESTE